MGLFLCADFTYIDLEMREAVFVVKTVTYAHLYIRNGRSNKYKNLEKTISCPLQTQF